MTIDSKIITVTLNPSLDRTLVTHFLATGYRNHTAEKTRLNPAGRGVNVARALYALQCNTYALVLVGGDTTGKAYETLVRDEQFPVKVVRHSGSTRSNLVILDTGHKTETQIIEESTGATPEHLEQVADTLRTIIMPGDTVVLAGDLPGDASDSAYVVLAEVARESGAQVVLTTAGAPLHAAIAAKPELLALNQNEVEGYLNYPVRTEEDAVQSAQQLLLKGISRVLVTSMERDSAVLVTHDQSWSVKLPDYDLGTSSGIEEAMLAGYLAGRAMQIPLDGSLGLGGASAVFAGSQVGNEFGTPSQIAEFAGEVEVLSHNGEDNTELEDVSA